MELFYALEDGYGNVQVDPNEFRHLKVLRKKEGDFIHLTNGQGNLYKAEILKLNKAEISINVIESEKKEYGTSPIIAIAPTKSASKMEFFVEKAVEIGVSEIYLMNTRRTERSNIRLDRLKKTALSAMKQSNRFWKPEIHDITSMKEIIVSPWKTMDKYIAVCDWSNRRFLTEAYQKDNRAVVCIGPEGGFTEEEIALAEDYNWNKVLLSHHRLRTETAGIFAVSVTQKF